ncbi:MAG: Squalene--hopene cyclase [Rhodospirillales bacterium]|nr:Squalene--hopene cyclase [Rhodospirillales bacterium]
MMRARLSEQFNSEGLTASKLEASISKGVRALLDQQRDDGHWVFVLEADATIPAEYILLKYFLDEVDLEKQEKLAGYIRETQADHGGWPLWHNGPLDISATVKAYWALKAAGDSIDAPHMVRARKAILAHGGAERTNVFTRIMLALFEQVPWRAVPVMPVEIMILPRWFPFHLEKISYWSRTVIVPLLVLMAVKPKSKIRIDIPELFSEPVHEVRNWHPSNDRSGWATFFRGLDKVLRVGEPLIPKSTRKRATDLAVAWVTERLNGEDGLGAIYPAMANSVMMYECLGFPKDDPNLVVAKLSIEKLLAGDKEGRFYAQPCVSPVWDTGLACHALLESGEPEAIEKAKHGLEWLRGKQILDVKGDWVARRPDLRPGGWAFQYENAHYPDLDDTAVVAMALDRSQDGQFTPAIERATEWVEGMQSSNGGWAAFEVDNEHYYLNHIPFADHGALLDPPTVDVTARCVGMLAQLGRTKDDPAVARALDYLRREQEPNGSWYGRWGTNYIYGTWSALCALNAVGVEASAPEMRKAVAFLLGCQGEDGGWGEGGESYYAGVEKSPKVVSTASQTAWAVLGLMAAGEVENPAVARGVEFLARTQTAEGSWEEDSYTAVGFPRVFYLRYHGYRQFFPVWAVSRYRNLMRSNTKAVAWGM